MQGPTPKPVETQNLMKYMGRGEIAKLALSLAMAKGKDGFSEKELQKLITWAEWTAFNSHMLQLILGGKLVVGVKNADQTNFDDMTFQSTLKDYGPSAAAAYEEMLNAAAVAAEAKTNSDKPA